VQQRLQQSVVSLGMARGIALLTCVGLVAATEALLGFQAREAAAESRLAALGHAATLRARVERELNAVLFLSSGLSGYLVVRSHQVDPRELQSILAVLHRDGRHVRNFGIAVGYRLTYVYPVAGNEKAIGVDYRTLPGQWPQVQRAIASARGTLAGPLALVQGGSGLVYRVPILADGKFWGLLSTVIDSDSFFRSAFDEVRSERYAFALRGRDGLGSGGEVFLGDPALFEDPASVRLDADVPNGKWVFAVRAITPPRGTLPAWIVRGVGWLAAVLLAWVTFALLRHRIELAQLAMVDSLTALPNRRLLDDRLGHAIHRHARSEDNHCAVIFLDLERFKEINDRHGHPVGDAVLETIARRIRQEVRLSDTIARWGGDEFVVVVEDANRAQILALVERLRTAIGTPLDVGGLHLQLGASVGTALYPEDGTDPAALLDLADQRMYADKQRRRPAAA
jgi:diguanylate cyclase (GGDEF)-like protein